MSQRMHSTAPHIYRSRAVQHTYARLERFSMYVRRTLYVPTSLCIEKHRWKTIIEKLSKQSVRIFHSTAAVIVQYYRFVLILFALELEQPLKYEYD